MAETIQGRFDPIMFVELDFCIARLTFQPANGFHAWTSEHILLVRRVGEFTCQILTGEVQILVQVESPFRAISHIVDDAFVRDKFPCAAFSVLAAQFQVRNEAEGDIHARDYTGETV